MITSMHIKNFKCFKQFGIELGPFNVLIGPNDSGKTSFLQSIAIMSAVGQRGARTWDRVAFRAEITLGPTLFWQDNSNVEMLISMEGWTDDPSHKVKCGVINRQSMGTQLFMPVMTQAGGIREGGDEGRSGEVAQECLAKAVGRAKYYLFNPAALRVATPISQEQEFAMSLNGLGFPTFLEDLLRKDRKAFFELEARFYKRFPHYQSIEVSKDGGNNVLSFKTRPGQELHADDVSDGAIYYLAFLAVTHAPQPPNIVLIEEPENGVHPSGLKATVEALRELSQEKGVQVILTTHSPYLLDLVEPEEVRVFAKDEQGAVHAAKLTDHPDVDDLKKHFMTGEIWTELDESDIVAKRGGGK